MSMLCLNVCRLCVPNIMSLGDCFIKKIALIKVGTFAWFSVKIRIIFGVRFERQKVDKKTETCKLYFRVFWIFLPNFIKIGRYNFEIYRFKVGMFFLETHTLFICWLLFFSFHCCAYCMFMCLCLFGCFVHNKLHNKLCIYNKFLYRYQRCQKWQSPYLRHMLYIPQPPQPRPVPLSQRSAVANYWK